MFRINYLIRKKRTKIISINLFWINSFLLKKESRDIFLIV